MYNLLFLSKSLYEPGGFLNFSVSSYEQFYVGHFDGTSSIYSFDAISPSRLASGAEVIPAPVFTCLHHLCAIPYELPLPHMAVAARLTLETCEMLQQVTSHQDEFRSLAYAAGDLLRTVSERFNESQKDTVPYSLSDVDELLRAVKLMHSLVREHVERGLFWRVFGFNNDASRISHCQDILWKIRIGFAAKAHPLWAPGSPTVAGDPRNETTTIKAE
ncbi:hypothetical protein ONZ45_g11053 [Pleurotus djamor]|nr:hypothetical protein ONZ45_g11053 [Pleurotus djamor]